MAVSFHYQHCTNGSHVLFGPCDIYMHNTQTVMSIQINFCLGVKWAGGQSYAGKNSHWYTSTINFWLLQSFSKNQLACLHSSDELKFLCLLVCLLCVFIYMCSQMVLLTLQTWTRIASYESALMFFQNFTLALLIGTWYPSDNGNGRIIS